MSPNCKEICKDGRENFDPVSQDCDSSSERDSRVGACAPPTQGREEAGKEIAAVAGSPQ